MRSLSQVSNNKESPLDSPPSIPGSPSPPPVASQVTSNPQNGTRATSSPTDTSQNTSQNGSSHNINRANSVDLTGRRPSFGLNFLSSFTSSIRSHAGQAGPAGPAGQNQSQGPSQNGPGASGPSGASSGPSPNSPAPGPLQRSPSRNFMANSPTIANFTNYNLNGEPVDTNPFRRTGASTDHEGTDTDQPSSPVDETREIEENEMDTTVIGETRPNNVNTTNITESIREDEEEHNEVNEESHEETSKDNKENIKDDAADRDVPARDRDGYYTVRLTPLIDHSSSNTGLYFAPIIRKAKFGHSISIGRYTDKNKASAYAPQGSSLPIVFKSKVVSRTHALFECNKEGQWFVKDCKSSSGTFLNHIRLSPALQESSLMPLIDGDIIQLGMDYRGGTEEVYRSVKMRCEFNKSWQRKVNQFNLQIHQKLKNLSVQNQAGENEVGKGMELNNNPINDALQKDELSECAICLLKLEPCQALFISPCSHSWHYKCIRPIIIKSYPQFYCPNCRSMCDLETDIEDDD